MCKCAVKFQRVRPQRYLVRITGGELLKHPDTQKEATQKWGSTDTRICRDAINYTTANRDSLVMGDTKAPVPEKVKKSV